MWRWKKEQDLDAAGGELGRKGGVEAECILVHLGYYY